MESMENLSRYSDRDKAIDMALWRNFTTCKQRQTVGVVKSIHGDYLIVPIDNEVFVASEYERLVKTYKKMTYEQIKCIRMQYDPLDHWQSLSGMFATSSGALLRYILSMQIPLERWIRYELAIRGYDQDGQWVGFNKAASIWLK